MIFGSITLENNAVVTHRDSYMLANLSVVSVRRPYLAGAALLSGGFSGFGLAFADLLYTSEITIIVAVSLAALLAGSQIGQLKLLSRDLKGSELSDAIYGQYGQLNKIRRDIGRAITSGGAA